MHFENVVLAQGVRRGRPIRFPYTQVAAPPVPEPPYKTLLQPHTPRSSYARAAEDTEYCNCSYTGRPLGYACSLP